uniref:Uncharacterized protein n=1 Tax=Branchiostoma floridae TaxID=7739 RepID=C3ZB07_BRAFL|eukprot:XP_002594033.1 hypothetical protein BRAFLDRAFT_68527 [Branchiostoma floridae]
MAAEQDNIDLARAHIPSGEGIRCRLDVDDVRNAGRLTWGFSKCRSKLKLRRPLRKSARATNAIMRGIWLQPTTLLRMEITSAYPTGTEVRVYVYQGQGHASS